MGRRCCCGCPDCTIATQGQCCACVCPTLCVTFTPADEGCAPQSVEIDWNAAEQAYIGELAGHDLRYAFRRGEEDDGCRFYLDSVSLGEHEWEVVANQEELDNCETESRQCVLCLRLDTEVAVPADPYTQCSGGTLTTTCVPWYTPTECNTCQCLCECLCVDVTIDSVLYTGKACWDEVEQAYIGTVCGELNFQDAVRKVQFPIDRFGDVCDTAEDLCVGDPVNGVAECRACEPKLVVDDDAVSEYGTFATEGTWAESAEGYLGTVQIADPLASSSPAEATWTFLAASLLVGRYKLAATWTTAATRATSARYRVVCRTDATGATRSIATVTINQENAPNDFSCDGANWEWLIGGEDPQTAGFAVRAGESVKVYLDNDADGDVCADALYLEYVDNRCAMGVSIQADSEESGAELVDDEWVIRGCWWVMDDSVTCEYRSVDYSWTITREAPAGSVSVDVVCAECNEDCGCGDICCPDVVYWPETLTLTISTPDCSVADGTQVTLTRHAIYLEYLGSFSIGGCDYNVSFLCYDNGNYRAWILSFDLTSGPFQQEAVEVSCTPFYWEKEDWFYLDTEACGPCEGEFPGAAPATYTITE